MTISRFHKDDAAINETSSTTEVLTLPASILAGDLIVISYAHRSTLTGIPSGFTDHGDYLNDTEFNQRTGMATKVAAGTESSTNLTFTQSSAGRFYLHCAIYRSDTYDLEVSQDDGLPGTSKSGDNLTAPTLSEAVEFVAVCCCSNEYGSGLGSISPLISVGTGWTKLNTSDSSGTNANRLSIADAFLDNESTPTLTWTKGTPTQWHPATAIITIVEVTGDVTAPTLSSPTGTATGSTTASGTVSTNEGNGTLYAVVTTSATSPSVAQVQAGQDHTGAAAAYDTSQSVSGTGSQGVSATGLSPSTAYYWHYQQEDAATNDSTVSTSSSFTTSAGAVLGARVTLYDGSTAQASVTGITAMWWDECPPVGVPEYTTASASTDGSGILEIDIDSVTGLDVDDTGTLMLFKLDGGDTKDSLAWVGELVVLDIS